VTAKDVIEVDASGRAVEGKHEPPKEVFLHTAIYRKRKDVHAVVYSHPLYSTILGVLGKPVLPLLANCTFIKSGIRLFEVPRFIGTAEMAEIMIKELDSSVALLLRGSGQGPIYGLGDRRAQAHCRRRNAGEVRQHADAFF